MIRYTGATVSGRINAPVEAIWELVSDVERHPQIAGSGEVQAVTIRDGRPLSVGAVFESQQFMRGIHYVTANRIVIWDPPYRFAWRVGLPSAPGIAQIWMFALQPEANGTRVTNGVALIYALPTFFPFSLLRKKLAKGYANSMIPTLDNLARMVNAPPPDDVRVITEPPAELTAMLPPLIVPGATMIAAVVAAVAGILALRRRRDG
ncbi:SRPBCC family protein [Chloroflexus sp.]|uniref:SRPBCC family protein n=1 Tax=Chloroflexus sp. TaxID=1904827 RepID=UPI00298F3E05|nr:SRPBCC family protein [Chloroflexus sp.]MCS6887474.1 SRPBCC family protein [Chloroflexus sp.]MDW8404465.1 SRPBCC family protein [Chloroflexus sp.]